MVRLMRWVLALSLLALMHACAIGNKEVDHAFEFDGTRDRWTESVDLLAYAYGDKYRMVRDDVQHPRGLVYKNGQSLPPQSGVSGPMPIGDFLYVKWRLRATGEVFEERVDLRYRLPRDMANHSLTFVLDERQIFVFVMTPIPKPIYGAPPLQKTWLSKSNVTYEIFPQLNKP